MTTKDELLSKYNGTNQDTKQEIIKFLWRYPDSQHEPETIYDAIKRDCRANTVETVRNNLSELVEADSIHHETSSFYQWSGEGRNRPFSRLQEVKESLWRWIGTLNLSKGSLLILFLVWSIGVVFSVMSLIALFAPNESLLGVPFLQWFIVSGVMMICSSAVVMAWVPMYLIDVQRARVR